MGNTPSTKRLQVPLQAQDTPFRTTTTSTVATTFTSFRIKPPSSLSTINVFNALSGQLVFQLKSSPSTTWQTLETASEQVVLSMKQHSLSGTKRVYDSAHIEQEAFRIASKWYTFHPSVIFAEFQDLSSGDACRVTVEGDTDDYAVLVYLERGLSPLPPVDKHDDRTSSRFQAIGRIRKAETDIFSSEEYFVDAAPGVDVALMVLLWWVRYDMERHRRQRPASSV